MKDPVLLHLPTRKSIKYFGAVRLRDGRLVYRRELDRFNASTCQAFLRQLRQTTRRGRRKVVVITDNAAYHHARAHRPWRDRHAKRFGRYFLTGAENESPSFLASIKRFNGKIGHRKYPGFTYQWRLIDGERHAGTKAESYVRGMRFVFAPLAPETGPSKDN